jgi:fibronectin type 3 domain-containing protein
MMKQNKTNPRIINKAIYSIKLFLILCLFCWPVQSHAQLENLDIELIENGYLIFEVEHECPAILNVMILAWNHAANYCKWFKIYISIDGAPEQLAYEFVSTYHIGDWHVNTPLSTLLHYSYWTNAGFVYHDWYMQIPTGKNVTFRTEGLWYWEGTESSRDYNHTVSYEFPAPGAPDGFSLSQSCSANALTWSAPSAMPSCAGTLVYDIYRRASGAGPYAYLTSTSSTSYTDNAPTGNDSYKIRARYTPEVPFSFTMPDGLEPNLGGANTTTRWPSYSVFTNALDAKSLIPATPTGLTATTDKCSEIKLDWSITGSPDAVKIYRNGTEIGEVGGMFRTFTDEPANPQTGTSYTYHLRAYNQGCAGSNSTSAVGRTFGDPTAPGNFAATAGTNSVTLTWTDAVNESRYIIKRSSASGATEFEVSANATSYTDNSVNGCEQYTYQIYAGNKCTEQGSSGIKAIAEPTAKLIPDLSAYLLYTDASKAYFPDKVMVEWQVQGNNVNMVDAFEISRSIAGENNFEVLGTVSGGTMYNDPSAIGGILYEYRVKGNLNCDGDAVSSNSLTTTGFRLPYGIVNGHIQYEDGVAVQGAEVLAEKASGTPYGNSLLFDGASRVTVPHHNRLNPASYLVAEAWIQPNSLAGEKDIITKQSGALGYRLYQNNTNVVFEININGTLRTVTAPNVLQTGVFTHVAGSFDAEGVKIYINGEIPSLTTFMLTAQDLSDLADIGFEEDNLLALTALQDIEYASLQDFGDAVTGTIGEAQQQRSMPLLVPLAQIVENIVGTTFDITGTINHSAADLIFGDGFEGYIDEIRIWNNAKDEEDINFDYKRIVGNDALGIAGYWRCDENFGASIYDASKSNGLFHKNNGDFTGAVTFSPTIPNNTQLGWVGVTNQSGDYTIPYVPYYGTGENFKLTPRFETHEFKPGSSTIFLGEGSAVINGQDFTDISSFKVTGTVFYANTTCGVEGIIITIDGTPVIKNGNVVMTDHAGEFEVEVPVGEHYVSVQKNGHGFKSYKFPPGPTTSLYNFQEDITGINFIDTTTIRIVGRVVGGTIQGSKQPGLGLSKNNIGVAQFDFEAATGCISFPVETDPVTGEYALDVPPMAYLIKNFDVPKNPAVPLYFNNEFPKADFSILKPEQTSSHTFSGRVDVTIKIDTVSRKATMDIEGEEEPVIIDTVYLINNGLFARFFYDGTAFQFPVDKDSTITIINRQMEGNNLTKTATYNYEYNLIYRTPPQIRVTATDTVSPFKGEDVVKYEDPATRVSQEFDLTKNPLNYPVFVQGKDYGIYIYAEEVYYNQDICAGINGCAQATKDLVPVNDGNVQINNQLAEIARPEPISVKNGRALYVFTAGEPNLMSDVNYHWRNYASVLNITVNVDGVGYEWLPITHKDSLGFVYELPALHPDDKYFRGYVLGSNMVEGSDFVTNGPSVVEMILRDPPGSESYSYLEKGTTFSFEKSLSTNYDLTEHAQVSILMGTKAVVGFGYSTPMDVEQDLTIGFTANQVWNYDRTLTQEFTSTESWSTSQDPNVAGAPSDIFMGASTNYLVSIADNLTLLPVDFADSMGLATAGKEANGHKIGLNQSLAAAPVGTPTYFTYTADHIENTLIPNLISLRNNLFINDPQYTSKLSINHELYGSNNDDTRWGNDATTEDPINTDPNRDYDGLSYTYVPKDSVANNRGQKAPKYPDRIREYNQQIRLWEEALERNEMEKYHSSLIKNISFDAGPTFEHSVSTAVTESHSSTFEASFGGDITLNIGGQVGGLGTKFSAGVSFTYTVGKTSTQTNTQTNTFGYVLHDPDQGDYFSVDVKDPGTGTGPVFAIQGGRSMCPHEKAYEFKYYQPTAHFINDDVVRELRSMFLRDQGDSDIEDLFIDILENEIRTKEWNFDYTLIPTSPPYVTIHFDVSDDIEDLIPNKAVFKIEQILNRQFNNKLDMAKAIEGLINLHLDMSLEKNQDLGDEIAENLSDMDQETVQSMSGQIQMDESNGFSKIYVFTEYQRTELKKLWARYRKHIYAITETSNKAIQAIGASTIQREAPVLNISPAMRENVPDNNKAYLTLQLGNNSYTGEDMEYKLKIIESTNPNGAIVKIDGLSVDRAYEIPAKAQINKTLSVEMGRPDIYEYDDIQIVLYSPCEPSISDTVSFSVHFVPSCTNISIARPTDDYIINSNDEHLVDGVRETKVPILLSDYDINNLIFDKMNFQFKADANPNWIITDEFHVAPEDDENGIPGNYTALEWNLSGYPDGVYNIRAKSYCGNTPDGTEIFSLSEVWSGVVDRKPPQVFGSPQPADGILSPNDDIVIEFNETIFGERMTKIENFDIRGILNGTEIRHDVSVKFDDDPEQFIRIPGGINVSGKSFTIEFWMKPARALAKECLFAQNTNPDDVVYIGLTTAGTLEIQVGSQKAEFDGYSVSNYLEKWAHYAVIYDHVRKEATLLINGLPQPSQPLEGDYKGFGDIYVGKSMFAQAYPFQGNIHELRVWERARTAGKIYENMLVTLSGKETALLGYWPLDDADGSLAVEKVHKRNATVTGQWEILPVGYAVSFPGNSNGFIDVPFSDIAFTREENFTIEMWFKGADGANQCLLSNGHGDQNDITLYYISIDALAEIVKVLPLEDSVDILLSPIVNKIYGDKDGFMTAVSACLGEDKTLLYEEQLLRFAKIPPTYWCINTSPQGHLQVNNNGKRITVQENYFDNTWHHLALVVERVGNTRIFIDGELKLSEPSTEWSGLWRSKIIYWCQGQVRHKPGRFCFRPVF